MRGKRIISSTIRTQFIPSIHTKSRCRYNLYRSATSYFHQHHHQRCPSAPHHHSPYTYGNNRTGVYATNTRWFSALSSNKPLNINIARQLLEVDVGTSKSELRKAYYKKAIKYHPDTNQDDPSAADKFSRLAEAYDLIQDHMTTGKASGMGSAPVEDLSPEEKAAREKRANTYHAQTRSRYTKSKWSGKVDPTSLFSNIAAEELDEEEDGSDGRGGQQGAEKANKKHMKNLQAEVAEAFEQYSGEGTRDGSDFPFPGFHDKWGGEGRGRGRENHRRNRDNTHHAYNNMSNNTDSGDHNNNGRTGGGSAPPNNSNSDYNSKKRQRARQRKLFLALDNDHPCVTNNDSGEGYWGGWWTMAAMMAAEHEASAAAAEAKASKKKSRKKK